MSEQEDRVQDPDQWLGPHLIKHLQPDCLCAVCQVLREYCGEADADHDDARLQQKLAEKDATIAKALEVLAPNVPESGLVDACRQVKQVAISEADNSARLEQALADHARLVERIVREMRDASGWCFCASHSRPRRVTGRLDQARSWSRCLRRNA